jgi:hypothetical protein
VLQTKICIVTVHAFALAYRIGMAPIADRVHDDDNDFLKNLFFF